VFKAKFLLQILTFTCLTSFTAIQMTHAAEKHIYGLNENVYLAEIGFELKAKLDTGAQTSSLSAQDIVHFDKDGEPWVRFRLAVDEAPPLTYELPLARVSKIKRRDGDFTPEKQRTYIKRPVVTMTIFMGTQQHAIEVNLTDRSRFEFPMLIGATALQQFNAIVDPSLEYLAETPKLRNLNNHEFD